jgi:hypothetical protein
MTTQETEKIRDSLWTEIRQLVLDEGPVVKQLDEALEACPNFPAGEREAFVATYIAERCAEIAALADGPFNGMPPTLVLGSWAGHAFVRGL